MDSSYSTVSNASYTAAITVEKAASTTTSDYEIWYELSGNSINPEVDTDEFVDYDVNDTVTATLYIKNKGTAPVSLQAYDIYLTHDSNLTPGTFTPTNDNKGVAKTDDGKFHLQAIGSNTETADININLPEAGAEGNTVELGKLTFTIGVNAVYNKAMPITLADNSVNKIENSTNIGIADYKTDGTTTGNKESKYPSVGGTTLGAEVMTTYDVIYNANTSDSVTGMPEPPTEAKQHNVAYTIAAAPTRVGYSFTGWNTKADGAGETYTAGTSYTANKDLELYAQWQSETVTITWMNGDVQYGDPQTIQSNTKPTAPTPDPEKDADDEYTYTFSHWETADGTKLADITAVTENTTFYAQYTMTKNQYTVTFNANGGTLADGASTTVKQDYNTPIPLPNATKTGHTLEGWYDGTEKVGTAGGSYTIKKNVELKAEWTADTYVVTLETMGGTIAAGKDITEYTYGVGATLPTAEEITKIGYTFGGWYTVEEPGADDTPVEAITATDTGAKVFYAYWTNNNYNIETVADPAEGGTVTALNSEGNTKSANYQDTVIVTVTENAGYEIGDVYYYMTADKDKADKSTTPISVTNGSGQFSMPDGSVTVVATFQKVDLAVTKDDAIDSDEGSVTVKKNDEDTETDKAQIEDTINLTVTPENGYQVKEVSYSYTDKDGKEVKTTITNPVNDVYTFTMPGYTVEVSAIFEPIEYTITYMDGESKIENLSPAKYTVESEQITLPSATKLGYDFKGWYTEPEFTNVVTTLTPADAEDKTYYAKFEIIEYTITYMDGSDPISGLIPNTYTVETGTVTLATYIKNGYTFEGWYDNAGFTGTAVATFNSMDVGNKTFYAKLTPITYTIKFVVPNGTAIADLTYTIESDYTLPEATNSNSLYTFKNWLASDAEGSWTNTEYNKGTEVKGKYGNVTLTAQWNEVLTYDIQEYKYAGSNQLMLLIATDSNTNAYTFDGETIFYSADTGYQIDKIENETTVKKNVFVTLISSEYVQDVDGIKRLTADGMAKVGPGTAAAADIRINGDINNDSVVNIADANIVYQMIVNGGGYYSADLLTADRLAADMVKDDNAVHRAAINDVNEIVNKINGTTTTNP